MATGTVKPVEKFFFFWKSKSPFSQWHKAEFVVDGVEFNCAEQYMMYRKASELISQQCVRTQCPHDQLGHSKFHHLYICCIVRALDFYHDLTFGVLPRVHNSP